MAARNRLKTNPHDERGIIMVCSDDKEKRKGNNRSTPLKRGGLGTTKQKPTTKRAGEGNCCSAELGDEEGKGKWGRVGKKAPCDK